MHIMHPPKFVQIGWGHHVNFCVWKKSAITFGEGCIVEGDVIIRPNLLRASHPFNSVSVLGPVSYDGEALCLNRKYESYINEGNMAPS